MTSRVGPKPKGERARDMYYACAWHVAPPYACSASGGCRVDRTDAEIGALALERLRELHALLLSAPDPRPPARKFDKERASLRRRSARLLDLVEGERAPDGVRERLTVLDRQVAELDLEEAREQAAGRSGLARRAPDEPRGPPAD
jgi:hypothetical protein